MMSASVAGGLSVRSRFDPALRRRRPAAPVEGRLPLAGIVVSLMGHTLVLAVLSAVVIWNGWHASRVHVVNLVPTIAAVGRPSAPPTPSLPATPTAPVQPRTPDPVPEPREMPTRAPAKLPEPSRAAQSRKPALPALPRPGERELPPLSTPTVAHRTERPAMESRPAPGPTASLGRPTGSVAGAGALSLDVSDFPYAWYLRQILQKVQGEWQRQNRANEPDQKPLVFVEIQRDGSIRMPKIEQSSGNSLYDQAALRAIVQASPFPPLPQDWTKPSLRVMFRFDLERS